MATIKLNMTDEVIMLVSNIRFKQLPNLEDSIVRDCEHVGYEIDMQSLYGGDFIFEDMSYILGIYDQHIEGTEENAEGPRFPEELENHMLELHTFILENLQNIEEIIHQFIGRGGVTPGIYKTKDYSHIWEKEV